MILKDAIKVNSNPEVVFRFFAEMESNYWRPYRTVASLYLWNMKNEDAAPAKGSKRAIGSNHPGKGDSA